MSVELWWARYYMTVCLATAGSLVILVNLTVPVLLIGEAAYSLVFTLIMCVVLILAQLIPEITLDTSGDAL